MRQRCSRSRSRPASAGGVHVDRAGVERSQLRWRLVRVCAPGDRRRAEPDVTAATDPNADAAPARHPTPTPDARAVSRRHGRRRGPRPTPRSCSPTATDGHPRRRPRRPDAGRRADATADARRHRPTPDCSPTPVATPPGRGDTNATSGSVDPQRRATTLDTDRCAARSPLRGAIRVTEGQGASCGSAEIRRVAAPPGRRSTCRSPRWRASGTSAGPSRAWCSRCPGLLLVLAVLAQAVGGVLWLPVIRRRIGSFGVGGRRRA